MIYSQSLVSNDILTNPLCGRPMKSIPERSRASPNVNCPLKVPRSM